MTDFAPSTFLVLIIGFLNFILGTMVLFKNRKNILNISFGIMALLVGIWSFSAFLFRVIPLEYDPYFFGVILYVVAAFLPTSFLVMTLSFPPRSWLSRSLLFILFAEAMLLVWLVVSPGLVIQEMIIRNGERVLIWGNYYFAYVFHQVVIFASGYFVLIKKYFISSGIEKKQVQYIILGTIIPANLALLTNLILPWLEIYQFYTWLGQVFMILIVIFSGYAISKHHLFNIKIIATEMLVLATVTTLLVRFFLTEDALDRWIGGLLFITISIFGILLIRSVWGEVEQKEKMEKLATELQVANMGQSNLLHLINHQIKGYITKARIVFAELLTEKEYEPISESAKHLLGQGEASLKEGVDFVQKILRASDIERGAFIYEMTPFDIKPVVEESFEELKKRAEEKNLAFELEIKEGEFAVNGDKSQLKEAIKNLLDNSINYTPSGRVKAILKKDSNKIIFAVEDTGVGISEELRPKLFTKGGRDKDSQKINVNSTGYGLSIVKNIVEAHKGRVWVESSGPSQGSTFFLELPTVS